MVEKMTVMINGKFSVLRMIHMAIISMYFVGMVMGPVTKMRSYALLSLLLLSLALLLKDWRRQQWDYSVLWFAGVFSATSLFSHVMNGSDFADLELLLLPLAFIPLVHVYRHAWLDLADWGMLLVTATIFCLLWNIYTAYVLDLGRMELDYIVRYIILYDMSAIALCLLAIIHVFEWQYRAPGRHWTYFVLALSLCAVLVLVLHGSRGAWAGIFAVLAWIAWHYRRQGRGLLVLVGVMCTLFAGWQLSSPHSVLTQRIASAQADMAAVESGHGGGSSLGARFILWNLAWSDFVRSPVFGAGLAQTAQSRAQAKAQGLLVADHPHAHNTYLQTLSVYGVLGFMGLMFLFLYPLWLFYRYRHINRNTRFIFIQGTAFVVYIMISALTDYYLGFASSMTFYCLIITMLLLNLKREQAYSLQ